MAITIIWTAMLLISVVCGLFTGQSAQVAAAAMEGATAGVNLCLSMAGALILWMGVMEVMAQCGLTAGLARGLLPLLRRLYPDYARDEGIMGRISANFSANLLGLGNAATPMGLEAARRMARSRPGYATDGLCMLIVCNTASVQLLPTTVAAVRSAAGCATPFDILPAVWVSSLLSVSAGVVAVRLLSRFWP